ncbi:hypothetical protein V6N12_013922 [Hibiscus sabdariffa]|uniref:Uncharacterized protein n=1 Tax=Hibiscus sabdariffa TaxID=183260 RepID=A0ABR2B0Y3_9ROSI
MRASNELQQRLVNFESMVLEVGTTLVLEVISGGLEFGSEHSREADIEGAQRSTTMIRANFELHLRSPIETVEP